MRSISVIFYQNLGGSFSGSSVTTPAVIKLGTQTLAIDDQLTKFQPGDMTVEVSDPDDSIWAFVQANLADGVNLRPPFIRVLVGGAQVFLGIVDPSRIARHLASDRHSIEFGAQDWSVMMSNQYLDDWTRALPKAAVTSTGDSVLLGYSPIRADIAAGIGVNKIAFPGGTNVFSHGDTIHRNDFPAIKFTVLKVTESTTAGYDPEFAGVPYMLDYTVVETSSVTPGTTPWSTPGANVLPWDGLDPDAGQLPNTANFTRESKSFSEVDYYQITAAVAAPAADTANGVYFLSLNTVDGITAGDVMHCILGAQTASWTVMSVDPELSQLTTKEEVSRVNIGDRVFFDNDSNNQIVMESAVALLNKACNITFSADLSRFQAATLPMPVFGWCVMRGTDSTGAAGDLLSVSDIEPTLTGTRVISGLLLDYTGSVDSGWTPGTALTDYTNPQSQHADWTNQLLAAPASLMPYTVRALSPQARLRNRCYHDFNWLQVNNGPTRTNNPDPTTWVNTFNPSFANTSPMLVFYDYLAMRRVSVVGNTTTFDAWTGTTWGAQTHMTWPTGNTVEGICNFPTGPGGALLGYVNMPGAPAASSDQLELVVGGSLVATCAVPTALMGAVLVPTPFGPYLVGGSSPGTQGYAQVVYSGGALSLVSAIFTDLATTFWPNTFVARTSTEAVVLGRVDVSDATGKTSATESWVYRLAMPPVPGTTAEPDASILWDESISEGVPVFAGAMRDPAKAGRVVGHYGGRLWQVDNVLPLTVERFTPAGMSSLECVEFIASLHNAMAVPTPAGKIAVISRGYADAVQPLTVSMVKTDQSRCWANFFSLIRATTQDKTLYYDAPGMASDTVVEGGNILEISKHPMLWSMSQAAAMAEYYYAWFGKPRRTEAQTWTFADANSAPPWEGLPPFARVTVNGTGPWRVMSMAQDYIPGTCDVILVEDV